MNSGKERVPGWWPPSLLDDLSALSNYSFVCCFCYFLAHLSPCLLHLHFIDDGDFDDLV